MALAYGLILGLLFTAASAQDIVLFGDSFSDNGGGYAANAKFVLRTNQTYPEPPYYAGRWSDGPTWIEVASSLLNVSLTDYGAGGATTGIVPAQVPPLPTGFGGIPVPTTVLSPTIPQQLNMHFLANNNSLSPTPLYFIFIGANDYFSIVFQNSTVMAEPVVAFIGDAMLQLYSKGARKFVLVNEPDTSTIPSFTQQAVYGFYSEAKLAQLKAQIARHNQLLQQLAQSFPAQHAGSSAFFYDIATSFNEVVGNATSYGFTNTKQACYVTAPNLAQNSVPDAQPIGLAGGTLCSNPSSYLFWDQFHPTKGVHRALGEAFVNQTRGVLFASS